MMRVPLAGILDESSQHLLGRQIYPALPTQAVNHSLMLSCASLLTSMNRIVAVPRGLSYARRITPTILLRFY
jgi:hypothetical protein